MKKVRKRRPLTRRKGRFAGNSSLLLALALTVNQEAGVLSVSAEELSFEGTTQMKTVDYSACSGAFDVDLTVEEVYVEEGSQIEEGSQLLKLTSESYQAAVDYYEAAIIRAEDALTDTQVEYDQGILEAKYEYEKARTEAEQAEFVRSSQERELEETITSHEEMQSELADKISEVEAGIAAGSYGSTQTGGGGAAGSGSAGGGSGKGGNGTAGREEKKETEVKEPETDKTENGEPETGKAENGEPETDKAENGELETDKTENGEPETDKAENGEPETDKTENVDSETGKTENGELETDKAENRDPETDKTENREPETGKTENGDPGMNQPESETEESPEIFQQISELKQQIETAAQAYEEVSGQIDELFGGDSENGPEEPAPSDSESTENELAVKLQAAIDGDAVVLGHLKNIRKMVENVPESVTGAAKLAGIDYEPYITLLEQCIASMEAGIASQREALGAISGPDASQESGDSDAESGSALFRQLDQISREQSSRYHQLVELEEAQISLQQEQINALQAKLEETEQSGQTTEQTQKPAGSENVGETAPPDDAVSNIPQKDSEAEHTADRGTGAGENVSAAGEGGNNKGTPSDSGNVSAAEAGGSSKGAPSASGNVSAAGAGGSSRGTSSGSGSLPAAETADGALSMEELNLTEEDISLFGETYDLSRMEQLLEQEPSDSERAEELLEQLEESERTVEDQLAELVLNKKITELKIQHTYDMAVLAGKLSEYTYEQERESWDTKLEAAKENKAGLEEKKQALEEMPEGIVTAKSGGIVAAVSCEPEDVLDGTAPILSFYDTDQLMIMIAVPQESITQLEVGDTVEVALSGMRSQTGTVQEKSLEIQEGTSRTTVNYEVTVAVENENGRLGSGMSAEVTIPEDHAAQEGAEEE